MIFIKEVQKVIFSQFNKNSTQIKSKNSLEILNDISTHLTMRIGEQNLTIKEISNLTPGSLISLNKSAAQLKVDILLDNNVKLGEGEIVVGNNDEVFVKIINLKK